MDKQIKDNLVYLADNLTNLERILLELIQNDIFSLNESEEIKNGSTSLNRNVQLLNVIQKNDLPIDIFLDILRNTQNDHCADRMEGIEGKIGRKLEKPKLLKNIWWPDKKVLIKSLHRRQIKDKLLIEELHERISRDENQMVVICESVDASKLTGLGGVGKTITATWYANYYENEYDHVVWIDAGEDSFLTSFKKLARDLEVKKRNELLDLEDFSRKSYEALEEFKCLWIFDNTERYRGDGGIQKILPVEKREFYCLITSRSKDWGIANGYGQISRLELDIFGEEEAVEFFRVNLNEKVQYTKSQLKELCRLLGYLPLAMQLAIAALNEGNFDLKNYIEKTTTADLDNIVDVQFDGYERTINSNVEITMELIREKKGNDAYDIILICGYSRPDAIPKEFLKAVLNIGNEKFNSAMELLTKYSLIGQETKIINEERQEVFSIHRLLQQVIRYNGRKTEKDTLRKILQCKGFVEYKLIPFTKYANEELRKKFPKIKAELVDQRQLVKLIKEERFEEAVELAKFIHEELQKEITKFNYAICLGKNGQLEDEITVLEEMYGQEITVPNLYSDFEDVEMGLLKLESEFSKSLVGGHLLVSHWKMDNKEKIKEILEERKKFKMIPSQEMVITLLRILNSINCNYSLTCDELNLWLWFNLVLDGDTKRIDFRYFTIDLSVALPNDLQELCLQGEKYINRIDVSDWLPKKLNTLQIVYKEQSQLILSLESISSIENITLQNCSLSLDSANRISPRNLKLDNVVFVKHGQELTNVSVNEFIDFHKMNRLELNCCYKQLLIDLSEESANMEYLYLSFVTVVSLKSDNGKVDIKEARIWDFSFDLSILPPSLEKLTLSLTKLSVSGGIDLPNLKYLELELLAHMSILSHFRSLQLTYLHLGQFKETVNVDVDLLPPSVKIIRIDRRIYKSGIHRRYLYYFGTTKLLGGVMDLDTLILVGFPLNKVEKMLRHFHIKQLVIYAQYYYDSYKPVDLIQLMDKQIPIIAIEAVAWGKEGFENSLLSKQVDRQSEYYLFQGGTGKAIEKKDFVELYKLDDTF